MKTTTTLSTADLAALKPKRSSFVSRVVLSADGLVLPEPQWRLLVGDVSGRKLTAALKVHGLSFSKVFFEDAYEQAKIAFYEIKHQVDATKRLSIIDAAFSKAGVAKTKKMENIIKAALPLFKKKPTSETIAICVELIKAATERVCVTH